MILSSAKKELLNREMRSYDWIKNVNEAELDRIINSLQVKPDFYTKPFLHQKACFLIGVSNPQFLFFLDLGTGKSKIILDIINYRKKLGEIDKVIILVPYLVSLPSWVDEIKKHAPNLKPVMLNGSTKQKLHTLFNEEGDIFLVQYVGFVHMCTEMVKHPRKKTKVRAINQEVIEKIASRFQMLVLDESHFIKNHNSWSYKVCNYLADYIPYRYALTGTPFGRDPHDVWSQFMVIDRGETFGRTLGIFRELFFNKKINHFSGYYDFVFDKRKKQKFHKFLQNNSISYKVDECSTLPEKLEIVLNIPLIGEAKEYFFDLINQRIEEGEQIPGIFIKIRQITSGFISVVDKDNNFREYIDFKENPRLDALMELIDSLPKNSKMVVFNEFIHSGDLIAERLEEQKIGYSRLYSGTKSAEDELNRFLNDKKCKIFIINSQSGAAGLNLQVANYVVFYETPTSPIVRAQAEKRCHRTGQKNTVFMFDLVSEKGVDRKILKYLKEGKDLHDELIRGKIKTVRDLVK